MIVLFWLWWLHSLIYFGPQIYFEPKKNECYGADICETLLFIFFFSLFESLFSINLKLDFLNSWSHQPGLLRRDNLGFSQLHDVTSLFASSNKKASQLWKFWREKHFWVEVNVLLRVQSTGKVLLCSKKILIKLLVAKLSLC